MNKEQLDGKWVQFKGKLKETWGKLTDDDFDLYNGKQDQFYGKLKEHYGIAKEEAEKRIQAMEKDCGYCASDKSKSSSTRAA